MDMSSLEKELAAFREKLKISYQSVDEKLSALEAKTCNSVDFQTRYAKVDELLSCQGDFIKRKKEDLVKIIDATKTSVFENIKCIENSQKTSAVEDATCKQVEELEEAAAQKNKEYNATMEEFDEKYNEKLAAIQALKDLIQKYRSNLGLEINRSNDHSLVFKFKYISEDDPEMFFWFGLAIENDTDYKVTDCQPLVPDLPELIAELNKTNNLKKFVHTMRKKFCILAMKGQ